MGVVYRLKVKPLLLRQPWKKSVMGWTLTRSPPLTWLSKFPYVSGDRESEVSLVMSWSEGRGQWENTEMSWGL